MLMPSKVKYRKQQRGRMRGKATRGSTLAFGDTGLQILEPGWITARQIEAARIAMTRAIKRGGKGWIRIFPDKPYTKKPAETRMGKGKGAPEGNGPAREPEPSVDPAARHRPGQDLSAGRRAGGEVMSEAAAVPARGRQTKIGKVVSDGMHKSIVVRVERRFQDSRYMRTIK